MPISYRWIKLYIEILDDPKMGLLPNHLWRRAIELFLMAGECAQGGALGSVTEIAWRLRVAEGGLLQALRSLEEIGIVHCTEENIWVVTKFADRQAAEPVKERVEAWRGRNRLRSDNEPDNEPVTVRYTEKRREEESREEKNRAAAAAAVYRLYEAEIGMLTPKIGESIGAAIDDYPAEWFEPAFQEAAKHNARNWKYVEAILKRWKTEGFQSKNGRRSKTGSGPPAQYTAAEKKKAARKEYERQLAALEAQENADTNHMAG